MDRRTVLGLLLAGVAGAQSKKAPARAARDFSKTQGAWTAPVKVEIFSDFQCPACATLHVQTVKPLIAEYVRTGKVYLWNRDFPLPGHAYSRQAAALATAAAGIGRYEQVADVLFRTQSAWSGNGNLDGALSGVLSPAELKTVHSLAASPEVAQSIEGDIAAAVQNGIRQTPTLFVGRGASRHPFSGAVAYNLLRQAIDALLKT